MQFSEFLRLVGFSSCIVTSPPCAARVCVCLSRVFVCLVGTRCCVCGTVYALQPTLFAHILATRRTHTHPSLIGWIGFTSDIFCMVCWRGDCLRVCVRRCRHCHCNFLFDTLYDGENKLDIFIMPTNTNRDDLQVKRLNDATQIDGRTGRISAEWRRKMTIPFFARAESIICLYRFRNGLILCEMHTPSNGSNR